MPVIPSVYFEVACVGRSETRGLGICALDTNGSCGPGRPALMDECELRYDAPCLCLVHFDEKGEPYPNGFVTIASSCLAYKTMYPGSVACMDGEWNDVD